MKKIMFNESKMGVEYIADVISACEAKGLMCIIDDANNEGYVYNPSDNKYFTFSDLRKCDCDVWDVLDDQEVYDEFVSTITNGDKFKDFAIKWNALEKKDDSDEVFMTNRCAPIHGNFTESE